MKTIILRISVAMLFTFIATNASAAVSADEIARLGKDLTPLGAERGGNAEGSIPEWKGGITTPPAGYKVGDHHPDPYPGDKPLFTITRANLDKYRGKLSAGLQKMVEALPDAPPAGLPDPAQRRVSEAHLRRHQARRRHRETRRRAAAA